MKTLNQLLEQSTTTTMQEIFIKAIIKEWLTQKLQKYGANGKSDDKFAFPEDVIKELIEEAK